MSAPTIWTKIWLDSKWTLSEETKREVILPGRLPRLTQSRAGSPVFWVQEWTAEGGLVGSPRCLASVNEGNSLQWNCSISSWLGEMREMTGREPRRPLYTKIPGFNVNIVPAEIRTEIYHRFFCGKASKAEPPEFAKSSGIQHFTRLVENFFKHHGQVSDSGEMTEFLPYQWPNGKKAAVVFTLDVDSSYVMDSKDTSLRDMLEAYGFKAAWYFLTGRYEIQHGFLDDLVLSGHEIGWHGHNHDHRFAFVSKRECQRRVDHARSIFEKYDVVGMRVDNFLWSHRLFRQLKGHLRYDTSMLDCYPFSETGNGCATSAPFLMQSGLWQLQTTITADHFFPTTWSLEQKLEVIRAQIETQIELGGMIHIVLHPEPTISFRPENLALLKATLEILAARRKDLFHVLPKELMEFLVEYRSTAKSNAVNPKWNAANSAALLGPNTA